jgi:hypothetical protein
VSSQAIWRSEFVPITTVGDWFPLVLPHSVFNAISFQGIHKDPSSGLQLDNIGNIRIRSPGSQAYMTVYPASMGEWKIPIDGAYWTSDSFLVYVEQEGDGAVASYIVAGLPYDLATP